MKWKILFVATTFLFAMLGCQKHEIIYDNYIENFRQKPENEWDYLYLLENISDKKIAKKKQVTE